MRRSSEQLEDDRLIRDSARRWFADRLPWRPGAPVAPPLAQIAENGWLAMGLGEEDGGAGGDRSQCLALLQEAGRVQPGGDLSALLLLPVLAGRAEARDLLGAFAEGRSSLALAATAAGPQGFGAGLTGISRIAPGLAEADYLLISAPDLVALAPAEGLAAEQAQLMDGRRAGRLRLSGALPQGSMLLAGGDQARVLHAELSDLAAFAVAADALGAFEAAFEAVIEYLKTRHQFGQPLAAFQAVQQHMANAFAAQEAFRSLVTAAGLVADPAERAALARHLALHLRRRLLPAAGLCIQVSGGLGMTEDFIAGPMYRRLQTAAALGLRVPEPV